MNDEREGLIEKKIGEIRELISEGQDRGVFFGITVLLFLALGIFVIADKLTGIGESLAVLVKRRAHLGEDKVVTVEPEDPLVRLFQPVYARDAAKGSVSVVLDTEGRSKVEVWVKSSGQAEFIVAGSADGEKWRQTDRLVLAEAGELVQGYLNGYRWVRVSTDAPGDNEIEISACR